MLSLFKSKQNKRIEQLFQIYKNAISKDTTPNDALMIVWGELKMRKGPLKERYGYSERSMKLKKQLLYDLFNPLDVAVYDICKTINFIVSWEFPSEKLLTVELIRNGRDSLSRIDFMVKKIGAKIL